MSIKLYKTDTRTIVSVMLLVWISILSKLPFIYSKMSVSPAQIQMRKSLPGTALGTALDIRVSKFCLFPRKKENDDTALYGSYVIV